MSQEIILEGSSEEIAKKVAEYSGKIIRAILVVDEPEKNAVAEDAWTRDFRRWIASHKSAKSASSVDYSRESIYKDRLG